MLRRAALLLISVVTIAPVTLHGQNAADQKVYRVGSGLTPPKALKTPLPDYPKRGKNSEVRVVLKTVIGTDGRAHDISVEKSGGPEFDEEAIKALSKWTFEPARKNGEPVMVQVSIEVAFHGN
jgi:periplasmic protein TonB